MDRRIRYIIAVIVAVVWGFNVIAGAVIKNYEESTLTNTVMLVVVGGLFGAGVLKRDDDKRKDDDEDGKP